jgi:hypothetical protein
VENVARLVNLQILSLSGNPLDSLDSLAEIAGLPMLRQLTFRCEHFSKCPVTELQGYRSYVLSTINQMARGGFARLDTEWVA